MNDHPFWLGFSLIPGIGTKRLLRLLEYFGDLQTAWRAKESELRGCGLDDTALGSLLHHRTRITPQAEFEKVGHAGAELLTLNDPYYPTLLRELEDAPAVLYMRGALIPQDELALSIVGTRKATQYGRDAAFDLARQLGQHGVTIVSGMAQGIDAAAHRGALAGGGRTIAVLGCGVNIVYPREHAELARQITAGGAIISEFPIGAQPIAANFPRRNRVVSGLSLGTLVVEAPAGSGALITASLAAEQGREVFAVPGSIYSHTSQGTNRLIQEGAKLVLEIADILDELNIVQSTQQTRRQTEQIAPESGLESTVLGCLAAHPIHIDDLVRTSGLSIMEVSSTLTLLELKGLAQNVGLMQYSRAFDP